MNIEPNAQKVILQGKPFALLPWDMYQTLTALSEELDDIRVYDAAVDKPGEFFPASLVERIIINEENPIKSFREYRKLTQQKLADKVGITRAYLAALEGGSKKGSIGVLKKIAKELQVDLDLIC